MIPHDDDINDIGDSTYYWRDLYLSTNIFFGTAYKITRDTNYLKFYVGTTERFSIGASASYINSNLLPSGTNDLGGSSNKWNNFYVAGDINISKSGETTTWLIAEQTGGSLLLKRSNAGVMSFASSYFSSYTHRPIADSSYDLGSSSYKWNKVYANTITDGLGNDVTPEQLYYLGKAIQYEAQPNVVTLNNGDTLTDVATLYLMSQHLPVKINGVALQFVADDGSYYAYTGWVFSTLGGIFNLIQYLYVIDKTTHVVSLSAL